jgi:NTE family protein
MTITNSDKKKTGLVLSGGGARGYAHLGVLQALDEYGIKIDMISGVSAGAIVGSLYAAGYKPLEILDILPDKDYKKFIKLAIPKIGFARHTDLYKLMKDKLPEKFEDLKIPTVITVTNLNAGKAEYFSEGPLARIVFASTSIPIVFHPVQLQDVNYVDGGVINNLPIEPLLGKCEFLIASHVNPIVQVKELGNMLKIFERCYHLAIDESTRLKTKNCQLLIEPKKLAKYKIFDFKKAYEIYEIGYEAALKALENFQAK